MSFFYCTFAAAKVFGPEPLLTRRNIVRTSASVRYINKRLLNLRIHSNYHKTNFVFRKYSETLTQVRGLSAYIGYERVW